MQSPQALGWLEILAVFAILCILGIAARRRERRRRAALSEEQRKHEDDNFEDRSAW